MSERVNKSKHTNVSKWNVVEILVFIMFNKKFCPKSTRNCPCLLILLTKVDMRLLCSLEH